MWLFKDSALFVCSHIHLFCWPSKLAPICSMEGSNNCNFLQPEHFFLIHGLLFSEPLSFWVILICISCSPCFPFYNSWFLNCLSCPSILLSNRDLLGTSWFWKTVTFLLFPYGELTFPCVVPIQAAFLTENEPHCPGSVLDIILFSF